MQEYVFIVKARPLAGSITPRMIVKIHLLQGWINMARPGAWNNLHKRIYVEAGFDVVVDASCQCPEKMGRRGWHWSVVRRIELVP